MEPMDKKTELELDRWEAAKAKAARERARARSRSIPQTMPQDSGVCPICETYCCGDCQAH